MHIDLWALVMLFLILLAVGVGLYQRGVTKGLHIAQELYSPLLRRIAENIASEAHDEQAR